MTDFQPQPSQQSYPPPPPPPGYGPQDYGQQHQPYQQYPPYGQGMQPGYGPNLASWGQRVGAYLIDVLILFALVLVVGIVAALFTQVAETLGPIVGALGYLAAFGFHIWNQGVRQGQTGQSFGKQKLGLRVLREQDGQPTGVGLGVGRILLHVLPGSLCFLYSLANFLWPLWDQKRQTLTDKIVSTVVVTG